MAGGQLGAAVAQKAMVEKMLAEVAGRCFPAGVVALAALADTFAVARGETMANPDSVLEVVVVAVPCTCAFQARLRPVMAMAGADRTAVAVAEDRAKLGAAASAAEAALV